MKIGSDEVALILVSALVAAANVAAVGGGFLYVLAGLSGPALGGL